MLFISHSSKDKAAAEQLKGWLLRSGYSEAQLFLDSDAVSGIPAGSDWERVLYHRLQDCEALVIIASQNWTESKWCFAELVYAKQAGKQIFPLILDDAVYPAILSQHQALFPGRDAAAYERLVAALENSRLGPKDRFEWDAARCPFPGMPAFDESMAAVYFGRERETQEVLDTLRRMRNNGEPRFLIIVGRSGSGKSSLLRAGVIPRLTHKTSSNDWLVLPALRLGQTPDLLRHLSINLVANSQRDGELTIDWRQLWDRLSDADIGRASDALDEAVAHLALTNGTPESSVIIPVDQFEELLSPGTSQKAEQFMALMHQCCSNRNGKLLFVATLRSDHLDLYEAHSRAVRHPLLGLYRLTPFPHESIGDIIDKPARLSHVHFERDLVERLKHDTPDADALPLLACTLEKLYQHHTKDNDVTLDQYIAMGGMAGAITQAISRCILSPDEFSPVLKRALRIAFTKHLAQINENDEVVRRSEEWSNIELAAQNMLTRFVDERLLTVYHDGSTKRIEVAHEAMFRAWTELREWLRGSVDILRWRRDIKHDRARNEHWDGLSASQLAVARCWLKERREELDQAEIAWIRDAIIKSRFRRAFFGGIGLAFSVLAALAVYQMRENIRSDATARSRSLSVVSQQNVTDDPSIALDLAIQAAQMAKTTEAEASLSQALSRHTLQYEIQQPESIYSIALSSDGAIIAARYAKDLVKLWKLKTGESYSLPVHTGEVEHVNLSDDGTFLFVTAYTDTTGSVSVWDVSSGKQLFQLTGHKGRITAISVSWDGRLLLTGSVDKSAMLWDMATGRAMWTTTNFPEEVVQVLLSRSGSDVLVRGSHVVQSWHHYKRSQHALEFKDLFMIDDVTFSPDGTRFAVAYSYRGGQPNELGHAIAVFDATSDRQVLWVSNGSDDIKCLRFSPRGDELIASTERFEDKSRFIVVWRVSSADQELKRVELVRKIQLRDINSAQNIQVSADEKYMLTYTDFLFPNAEVRRYDSGEQVDVFHGMSTLTRLAIMSADGRVVLTSSEDHKVQLWDVSAVQYAAVTGSQDGQLVGVGELGGESIFALEKDGLVEVLTTDEKRQVATFTSQSVGRDNPFSPDGNVMISYDSSSDSVFGGPAAEKANIYVHTSVADSGKKIPINDEISRVKFSSDGARLVALTNGGWAVVVNLTQMTVEARLNVSRLLRGEWPKSHIANLNVSRDGTRVVTLELTPNRFHPLRGFEAGVVRVWSSRSASPVITLADGVILAASLAPDGSSIVTGNSLGGAAVWDAVSGRMQTQLTGHTGAVVSAVFSRDGTKVATVGIEGTVRVWEARSGDELGFLRIGVDRWSSAEFSPDGSRLLVTGSNGEVKVWDLESRLVIYEFSLDRTFGGRALWTPDGRSVVMQGEDSRIRIYPVNLSDLLRLAYKRRTVRLK